MQKFGVKSIGWKNCGVRLLDCLMNFRTLSPLLTFEFFLYFDHERAKETNNYNQPLFIYVFSVVPNIYNVCH